MGGDQGKLRCELQQSGGNRAQVKSWGHWGPAQRCVSTGQFLLEDEVEVRAKKNILRGFRAQLPCEGQRKVKDHRSRIRQYGW